MLVCDCVILSCGEDCSVTVIKITRTGSLEISHILQVFRGHQGTIIVYKSNYKGTVSVISSDPFTKKMTKPDF